MSNDEYDAIREESIEAMERSAEVYGLSRSAGRVFGVLYFSDDPLSIPELVEETGYAKSTISNVTRKLTRIGMVRRRSSQGGGRRIEFAPETDLWVVIQDVLQQHVSREMQTTHRTLDRLLRRHDSLDEFETGTDKERIRELADSYDRVQTLLELAMDHSPDKLIEAIENCENRDDENRRK